MCIRPPEHDPLDMDNTPTPADDVWYAQEAAKEDGLAAGNWDTVDRRQEFARTLHGKETTPLGTRRPR
jgi:hypothetical protein